MLYNEERIGKYNLEKLISKGTFSHVYTGRDENGNAVALKYIKKERPSSIRSHFNHNLMLENEIKATKLIHPHIIETLEVIETPQDVWLVQTFCKGGDLASFIAQRNSNFAEDEARIIFKQVSCALEYATKKGFVHRDIKPANLLLLNKVDPNQPITDIHVVVADWGFCTTYSPHERTLFDTYGSLGFAAPEVINGLRYFGPEVDVWSLGVTLFYLLTNTCPFVAPSTQGVKKNIEKGVLPDQVQISCGAKNLLKKMIHIKLKKRISIYDVLAHPWTCGKVLEEPAGLRLWESKLPFFSKLSFFK